MNVVCDLTQLRPDLFIWQNYDPAVKADLFSSAVTTLAGNCLVDPIALDDSQFSRLTEKAAIAGIVVTNANHHRASAHYAEKCSVPIFAHRDSFPDKNAPALAEVADGTKVCRELEVIAIEGAVPGEIALYDAANGGTLIVGDALINFEPYGFTFLPRKYCRNEKEMRRSLRKLLTRNAERLLFAHGTPILSAASARLQQVLDVDF
jgi:glyoxylase-like metal-dependent hydrolase (beta-lactamase superfamily II)